MSDDKVYTPTVINDQPFPQADPESNSTSQSTTGGTFSSETTQDQSFPTPKIAQELLSSSLNTRSKRILQQYQFAQQGAIQIGLFTPGISGDLRLSPDGIVARNLAGETTFAIDGTTGDAIFAGDIRAATFTSDNFNVDAQGNVVASSIKLTTQNFQNSGSGLNQQFTSSTEVDVTSSTMTFTLERASVVLILADVNAWLFKTGGGAGDWGGNGIIHLIIDSVEKSRSILAAGRTGTDSTGALGFTPMGLHTLISLSAGAHTIKLTGSCDTSTSTTFNVYNYRFSYITLGNS